MRQSQGASRPSTAPPIQDAQAVRGFVAFVPLGAAAELRVWPARGQTWSDGRITVWWLARTAHAEELAQSDLPTLLHGDVSEFDAQRPDRNLGGGVPIRFDAATAALIVHTSIVGLPPVYLYRGARVVALASDIHLLRNVPGVELELDACGIEELARIGHPVGHRTLFRDVTLLPSAACVTLGGDGDVRERASWSLPEQSPLSAPDFIEAQIGAFTAAVRRLDLSNAFLSLTAGLDTRTVFAVLDHQQRAIPAATMTGVTRSLDARAAARLCRAYGVDHHEIIFDDRFVRELPRYVEAASRLSGGLASLDQAPEVYFYTQLGGGFATRLSGNLGNQIGRGGTEGVSTRGASVDILSRDITAHGASAEHAAGHWLLDELNASPRRRIEFILTHEIPFTLASNYPVGNHFALQLTPYADRRLIETLARRPLTGTGPSRSKLRMRLRDLSHRFIGEPADTSFQRTLLRRTGGFAAHYPINWGWRAQGGVSPAGLVLGCATLFGMYARSRGLDAGLLRRLPALHDFRESRRWLRDGLREFTFDTLATAAGDGVFDNRALQSLLRDHFGGRRDSYATVTFALDLALARRNLCTTGLP